MSVDFIDNQGLPQSAPIQVMAGVTPQNQPKPAFRLVELPQRTREVTICTRDELGFRMEKKQVTDEAPYMVVMPKGHSVYISSLAELKALKLAEYVPMLSDTDYEPTMAIPVAAVTEDRTSQKKQ